MLRVLFLLSFAATLVCRAAVRSDRPQVITTDRDGIWVFTAEEDGSLGEGRFYFVGTEVEPWHLAAADLNGDGLMDVVSSNRYGPSVAVFINRGDGFADPVIYDAGPKPYHAAAGDFDGDGDQDLAVANPVDGGTLVLLENDGTGEFGNRKELHLGDGTYAVISGDVDGDGRTDLVVVNNGSEEILVLLGKGDGTFTRSDTLKAEKSPKDVVFADFNEDDLPDLAVANYYSASVTVFINDGDGFFDPGRSFSAGVLPRHLAADDLDGDGIDDLVVAGGKGSEDIYVLFGEGGEELRDADIYHTGPRPNGVAVFDLDGDWKKDILAANWSLGNEAEASVTVLRGAAGDRTFTRQGDYKPPEGFAKLTFLLVGRFNSVHFLRGDASGDGTINISDPILILRFLFSLRTLDCLDAADVDDGGMVNIADPVRLLAYLFASGPPPSPPFPDPGPDPTPDNLWCGG